MTGNHLSLPSCLVTGACAKFQERRALRLDLIGCSDVVSKNKFPIFVATSSALSYGYISDFCQQGATLV